jgi:hypothetical protein
MLRTGVDVGVLTAVVKKGLTVAVAEKDVTLPPPPVKLNVCPVWVTPPVNIKGGGVPLMVGVGVWACAVQIMDKPARAANRTKSFFTVSP